MRDDIMVPHRSDSRLGALSEVPQSGSLLSVVAAAAANPDVDGAKFELLMRLMNEQQDRQAKREEEDRAREAKHLWDLAMNAVQSEILQVMKTKDNTQTKSKYAALEDIDEMARPIYTGRGFSLTFKQVPADEPKHVKLICTATHTGGHSEDYPLEGRVDNIGPNGTPNKTELHGVISTTSVVRRVLTCLVFNIVARGQDDDGNSAGGRIDHRQSPADVLRNGDRKVPPKTWLGVAICKLEKLSGEEWVAALVGLLKEVPSLEDVNSTAVLPGVKDAAHNAPDAVKTRIAAAFKAARERLTAKPAADTEGHRPPETHDEPAQDGPIMPDTELKQAFSYVEGCAKAKDKADLDALTKSIQGWVQRMMNAERGDILALIRDAHAAASARIEGKK